MNFCNDLSDSHSYVYEMNNFMAHQHLYNGHVLSNTKNDQFLNVYLRTWFEVWM